MDFKEFLYFMFSDFWIFWGMIILIGLVIGVPAKLIMFLYNRSLRFFILRKHGYPPAHCDADGDHIEEIKKND